MPRDVRLIRTPLSIAGMVLTTISAAVFLVVWLADVFGLHTNPYIDLVIFLILPALFLVGLALIPIGAWRERRHRASGKPPTTVSWPRIDLNDPTTRTTAVIVFALTVVNIIIVSLAAYGGVTEMDSVQFCGQVCHTVMTPEFVAHKSSPHANVACVACHVGTGASSFARTKLAGTRRLFAVAFHTYSRPIVARPDQLVPATDTCERCHNPEEWHADKVVRVIEYSDDAKNTPSVTTLQMHVGGGSATRGEVSGIHWHANPDTRIEYVATDATRQTIPYVRVTDAHGNVREYVAAGVKRDDLTERQWRLMDCTDCHNRSGHAIGTTPERVVNEAMIRGAIPITLPFVHREAVKALKVAASSDDSSLGAVSRSLRAFYRGGSAGTVLQPSDVDKAVASVDAIYERNVFPAMNGGCPARC